MKMRNFALGIIGAVALVVTSLSPAQAATYTHGKRCTILGTSAADSLQGTPGDDVICGLGGNDQIIGGDGNDTIDAGTGNDSVEAGPGADKLFLGDGNDALLAGEGDDWVDAGAGNDILDMGDGSDTAYGGPGADKLFGDAGADKISGGDDTDWMSGGTGIDVTDGNGGSNQCSGDPNDVRKHCVFNNTGPQLVSIALAEDTRSIAFPSDGKLLHLRARIVDYGGRGFSDFSISFTHPAGNNTSLLGDGNTFLKPNIAYDQLGRGMASADSAREDFDSLSFGFSTRPSALGNPLNCPDQPVQFPLPNAGSQNWYSCLLSGTLSDGIYDMWLKPKRAWTWDGVNETPLNFLKTGKYFLSNFTVWGLVVNNTMATTVWDYPKLQARGFNVSFTQTTVNEEAPPKVLSVATTRRTINTFSGDQRLTVRARITDLSGVRKTQFMLGPNLTDGRPQYWSVTPVDLFSSGGPCLNLFRGDFTPCRVSGTELDGIYEFSWMIHFHGSRAHPPKSDTQYLRIIAGDNFHNQIETYFAPQYPGSASEISGYNNGRNVIGVTFTHHK